jgi:hypothetical protein
MPNIKIVRIGENRGDRIGKWSTWLPGSRLMIHEQLYEATVLVEIEIVRKFELTSTLLLSSAASLLHLASC